MRVIVSIYNEERYTYEFSNQHHCHTEKVNYFVIFKNANKNECYLAKSC